MNSKQAKKIRKNVRQAAPDLVQMFGGLKRWPFKMRLQLAWQLIRGSSRKPTTQTRLTMQLVLRPMLFALRGILSRRPRCPQ